jgi:soluble lytic murein transglycosylase
MGKNPSRSSWWLILGLLLFNVLNISLCLANAFAATDAGAAALEEALDLVAGGQREEAIQSLQALARERLPLPVSQKVDFLLGILYAKEKNWDRARPYLEQAVNAYPQLLDYSLFYLAEVDLQRGQPSLAIERLGRLLALPQESRWKRSARLRLADAHRDAREMAAAESAYRGFLRDFPNASDSIQGRLSLAELLLAQGREEEATPLLLQIDLKAPSSCEAKRARALWSKLTPPLQPSWKHLFQRAQALFSADQYEQAAKEFKELSFDPSRPAEDVRRATLLAAVSRFHSRNYRGALELFLPMVEGEGGPEAEEALYWTGRSYLRLGRREEGRFHLLWLNCRFPKGTWADDALYRLGLDEESEVDFFQAEDTYGRLIRAYPESRLMKEALWRRGWVSYRQGEYLSALKDFQALLSREANSPEVSKWLYWMGRSLEKMDRYEEAARRYEEILSAAGYDYYFFRALSRLAGIESFQPEALGKEVVPDEAPPAVTSASIRPSDAAKPFLGRARELTRLGLYDEALAEYAEAISLSSRYAPVVEEACSQSLKMGRPDKTLIWATRFLPRHWRNEGGSGPSDQPLYHYPLGYWEIVQRQEKAFQIDPYLVVAVIREESAFSPWCVSSAGAKGLMQLMPATASLVARGGGTSIDNDSKTLFQPELNIRLGAHYLRDLLQEFKGNLTLSLASYNAGPHRVRRWLDLSPYLDEEEFAESIPFSETRSYVKKVLRSYEVYKILYEGKV